MWQRFMSIDRRWVFLAIGLAVFLPYALRFALPLGTANPRTRAVYEYIEKAKPGSAIVLAVDYGPASMPELHPMAIAITRHALRKNLRVIGMTLNTQGTILTDDVFQRAVADPEFRGKKDGTDYVNLGFKPGGSLVILQMGDSIEKAFSKDARGRDTKTLPIMRGLRNFRDIHLVMALESTTAANVWIMFAHERFKQALAYGVTAVMATDYYPYLSTGQIVGLVNGMKGAAEYEGLVGKPDDAMLGMTSQSIATFVIILFVVLGNIGFFASRRARAAARLPASGP